MSLQQNLDQSQAVITPSILNPISMPLEGLALIEASAGTGKTYTLAALYLRLLLGLGRSEPLEVSQILVVTFTEAATQELRERIRARIQEARIAFVIGSSNDPYISQLLEQHQDHPRAVLDLEYAASEMDQAAIFTIHGFCQRMLTQHAFESGANFNAQLVSDDSDIVRQALLDYWRVELYQAPDDLAAQILSHFSTPDQLFSKIRSYLSLHQVQLVPDYSNFDLAHNWQLFLNLQQQLRASLEAVLQSDDPADDLQQIIQNSSVNKTSYSKKNLPNWYSKLVAFAAGDKPVFKDIGRFSQSALEQKCKTADVPRHKVFEEIEQFCEHQIDFKAVIFCRALNSVRANMGMHKAQFQQMSFDDLLEKLASALKTDSTGNLSSAIRSQYPFALIDEFQDTDAQQYYIFSQLYRPLEQRDRLVEEQINRQQGSARHSLGLLMIGDPKQAIYAFRGADIFTYISARRQVTRHFTLDTNWRSSGAMVSATNQLFSRCPAPFIYAQDIPFYPMKAAKQQASTLKLNGRSLSAMNIWLNEKKLNNDQYLDELAAVCAAQIDQMLRLGELKNRPVTPANIAILVRDRKEAGLLQKALSGLQIDSVFMSNRDNVYSIYLAQELIYILQAVNEPSSEQRLRSALATQVFHLTASELFTLNQDEIAWEQLVDEFVGYRKIWRRSGVLAMLQQLLQKRRLAERWLSDDLGERLLTDYLHLAELLQQASASLESTEALIRFLQDRRAQPSSQANEQQLRLDSDRTRVTIITIHKSKGLEYDLVYLPFICRYRAPTQGVYHDDQGQPVLDLVSDSAKEKWHKEQLAEDLRLLYVAITRAAHGCFLGMADVSLRAKSVWQKTAIGYLLSYLYDTTAQTTPAETIHLTDQSLLEVVTRLAQECADIEILHLQSVDLTQGDMFSQGDLAQDPQQKIQPQLSARQFSRHISRDWRVTSYSALVKGGHQTSALESVKLDLEVTADEQTEDQEASLAPVEDSIFTFPKGAVAGTFLHSIYEEIDFCASDTNEISEVLEQKLMLAGYELSWLPCLRDFIFQSLAVPLNTSIETQRKITRGEGASEALTADSQLAEQDVLRLNKITSQHRLVEMEFVLVLSKINSHAVNQLLRQYDPLAMRAGELLFESVSGMLKGFIDLTIRFQGKYYVIDYKSNYLGNSLQDYTSAAMEQAMVEHRYDFQYVIYTLALHRLLRTRVADYQYEEHIGGVFYLFLRGLDPQSDSGVFYTKPDKALILALDKLFEGGQ